jgi:hypothetical protein
MALVARALTPPVGVAPNSDLESLEFRDGALVIVLACSLGPDRTVHGLRVTFTNVSGFRVLDEVNLIRFWASEGYPSGSHVLEVDGGGWSAEQDALQASETMRREWLVVTGNLCVSVFSLTEPAVIETAWEFVE